MGETTIHQFGPGLGFAVLIIVAASLFDRLLKKPKFGPEAFGLARTIRLAMLVLYSFIMASLALGILFGILLVPTFVVFDLSGSNPSDTASMVLIMFFVFVVCAYCWHFLFFHFPAVMIFSTKTFLVKEDISKFPQIIDYAYYLFASIGISYAFLELSGGEKLSKDAQLFYLFLAIQLISLRFTKVTIERKKDKYLDGSVYVRGFDGSVLFSSKKNKQRLG
ncbi:hypothetical protein [uncultured Roseovarius sp.]|uniref:hypothetical protein n=1 Tax=uncultured Roseovarius sp. TaxID=293344 RepID=UPI00260A37DA|nr:hypothetical protein [uncultured Roseovarius sp.]